MSWRISAFNAWLQDIGKLGVSDSILLKSGPLSEDEWIVMRKQPVDANELLYSIAYRLLALNIPIHIRDNWDGKGYRSHHAGRRLRRGGAIIGRDRFAW